MYSVQSLGEWERASLLQTSSVLGEGEMQLRHWTWVWIFLLCGPGAFAERKRVQLSVPADTHAAHERADSDVSSPVGRISDSGVCTTSDRAVHIRYNNERDAIRAKIIDLVPQLNRISANEQKWGDSISRGLQTELKQLQTEVNEERRHPVFLARMTPGDCMTRIRHDAVGLMILEGVDMMIQFAQELLRQADDADSMGTADQRAEAAATVVLKRYANERRQDDWAFSDSRVTNRAEYPQYAEAFNELFPQGLPPDYHGFWAMMQNMANDMIHSDEAHSAYNPVPVRLDLSQDEPIVSTTNLIQETRHDAGEGEADVWAQPVRHPSRLVVECPNQDWALHQRYLRTRNSLLNRLIRLQPHLARIAEREQVWGENIDRALSSIQQKIALERDYDRQNPILRSRLTKDECVLLARNAAGGLMLLESLTMMADYAEELYLQSLDSNLEGSADERALQAATAALTPYYNKEGWVFRDPLVVAKSLRAEYAQAFTELFPGGDQADFHGFWAMMQNMANGIINAEKSGDPYFFYSGPRE